MGFIAKTPISHDGKLIAVGKPMPDLDDEQIDQLLGIDAIEAIADAPAGADAKVKPDRSKKQQSEAAL